MLAILITTAADSTATLNGCMTVCRQLSWVATSMLLAKLSTAASASADVWSKVDRHDRYNNRRGRLSPSIEPRLTMSKLQVFSQAFATSRDT